MEPTHNASLRHLTEQEAGRCCSLLAWGALSYAGGRDVVLRPPPRHAEAATTGLSRLHPTETRRPQRGGNGRQGPRAEVAEGREAAAPGHRRRAADQGGLRRRGRQGSGHSAPERACGQVDVHPAQSQPMGSRRRPETRDQPDRQNGSGAARCGRGRSDCDLQRATAALGGDLQRPARDGQAIQRSAGGGHGVSVGVRAERGHQERPRGNAGGHASAAAPVAQGAPAARQAAVRAERARTARRLLLVRPGAGTLAGGDGAEAVEGVRLRLARPAAGPDPEAQAQRDARVGHRQPSGSADHPRLLCREGARGGSAAGPGGRNGRPAGRGYGQRSAVAPAGRADSVRSPCETSHPIRAHPEALAGDVQSLLLQRAHCP